MNKEIKELIAYYRATILFILVSDDTILSNNYGKRLNSLFNNITLPTEDKTLDKASRKKYRQENKTYIGVTVKSVVKQSDLSRDRSILKKLRKYLQIDETDITQTLTTTALHLSNFNSKFTGILRTFIPLHHKFYQNYNLFPREHFKNSHRSFMVRESSTGDGDCLFHSICYLVNYGGYQDALQDAVTNNNRQCTDEMTTIVKMFRNDLANYVKQNPLIWEELQESIQDFRDPQKIMGLPLDKYYNHLKKSGEWGEEFDFKTIAKFLDINLIVINDGTRQGTNIDDYQEYAYRSVVVGKPFYFIYYIGRTHFEPIVFLRPDAMNTQVEILYFLEPILPLDKRTPEIRDQFTIQTIKTPIEELNTPPTPEEMTKIPDDISVDIQDIIKGIAANIFDSNSEIDKEIRPWLSYSTILEIMKQNTDNKLTIWKKKPQTKTQESFRFGGDKTLFIDSITAYINNESLNNKDIFLRKLSSNNSFQERFGLKLTPNYLYGDQIDEDSEIAVSYKQLINHLWNLSYTSELLFCNFGVFFEYAKKKVLATQLNEPIQDILDMDMDLPEIDILASTNRFPTKKGFCPSEYPYRYKFQAIHPLENLFYFCLAEPYQESDPNKKQPRDTLQCTEECHGEFLKHSLSDPDIRWGKSKFKIPTDENCNTGIEQTETVIEAPTDIPIDTVGKEEDSQTDSTSLEEWIEKANQIESIEKEFPKYEEQIREVWQDYRDEPEELISAKEQMLSSIQGNITEAKQFFLDFLTSMIESSQDKIQSDTIQDKTDLELESQTYPQDSSSKETELTETMQKKDSDVDSTQLATSPDISVQYPTDTDNPEIVSDIQSEILKDEEPIKESQQFVTSTDIQDNENPIILSDDEQRIVKISPKDATEWNRLPKISIRNELFRVGHKGILYIEDDLKQVYIVGQIQNYKKGEEPEQAIILWTKDYSKQISMLAKGGGYVSSDMNNMSSVLAKKTELSEFNNSDTIDNTYDIFNEFSLQTVSSMSSLSAEHT